MELDVPAPPKRPVPPALRREMAEDTALERRMDRRLPPPLTTALLSRSEAFDRISAARDYFGTLKDLLGAWHEACPELAEMLVEFLFGLSEDEDYVILNGVKNGLAIAWAALGGASVAGPLKLDATRLRLSFEETWAKFDKMDSAAEIAQKMSRCWPVQPDLLTAILNETILDAKKTAESEGRPGAYLIEACDLS